MSAFWVTISAAWIAGTAVALLIGGIVSGAWLGGLLWSIGAVVTLVGWLRLRRSTESAQVVADRMIFATMFLLLGLVLPAFDHIATWLGDVP
jgi:hypothetical protein